MPPKYNYKMKRLIGTDLKHQAARKTRRDPWRRKQRNGRNGPDDR